MAFQKRLFAAEFSIAVAVFLLSPLCNSHNLNITAPDKDNIWTHATSVYDFVVIDFMGRQMSLELYKGLMLIIVNIDTNLSSSPDKIEALNELYYTYSELGLKIIAFPTNTLLHEVHNPPYNISFETVLDDEIVFDITETTIVNGPKTHPLWKYLKLWFSIKDINESFTKFLIDRTGKPVVKVGANITLKKMSKYLKNLDRHNIDLS